MRQTRLIHPTRRIRPIWFALSAGVVLLAIPGLAAAQMLSVGPRFSMVRGDLASDTPTTRFVGGTMRINPSRMIGLEGSIDTRTTWDTDRTQRLRETPVQGSVLVYPFHAALSPYALGGFGVYTRNYDLMGPGGVITETAQERRTGIHLGFGGELRLAKHAVAYMDYRYRFVKFHDDETPAASTGASGSVNNAVSGFAIQALLNSVPGLDALKFSHQGSMWTGGVAFVF
jgi:hypothetical protein